MAKRNHEMDMCQGPLLGKILVFSLPLMLSGMLQLLFNAADIIVVGKFAGDQALAAVGATGALINLIVNAFIGLSVGVNVLVARLYGAGETEQVSEAVHTSILLSFISGCILVVVGLLLTRPLLEMMGTPADVIDMSATYMRIFFCGMPVQMLYNFGAAILRSVGDTKRPLYFLLIAGVLNVLLNLFFVIVLGMDVDGVALATVLSQIVSAVLIVLCLMRTEGACKLNLRKLRIYKDKMVEIVRVGLPAGIQGCVFALSNVLIQSSVNSFGSVAMAGNTASGNIEGFVYTAMNSIAQAAISFTSQNRGAKQYQRIGKIFRSCLLLVTLVGLVLGLACVLFGEPLLHVYTDDPQVVEFGMMRMKIIATLYFICGIMDVMAAMVRGLGYSILPMVVSLTGACGLRILWVYTIFAANRSLTSLYISYPVSWGVTALVHIACYFWIRKSLPSKDMPLAPDRV